MANKTRVNLKHLLEDLRDAYACPFKEVIVTEPIANTLDGGATCIRLEACPDERVFRCIDNGEGMNRVALRSYHDIAASTRYSLSSFAQGRDEPAVRHSVSTTNGQATFFFRS